VNIFQVINMPLIQSQNNTSKSLATTNIGSINKIPKNWLLPKNNLVDTISLNNIKDKLPALEFSEPEITEINELNDLKNTIKDKILNITQNRFPDKNEHSMVAIYGFSHQQLATYEFIKSIKPNANVETIAKFNRQLGLVKRDFDPDYFSKPYLYRCLKQLLDDLTFALSQVPQWSNNKEDVYFSYWKNILNENKYKTDIFNYIDSKEITIDEKTILLKKLIVKNTPDSVDADKLEKFIIENNILDCRSLSDMMNKLHELYTYKKDTLFSNTIGLLELIQNHFFRNTSKLGLKFFNDINASVIMAWNSDYESSLSLDKINQKEYKNGNRRSFENKGVVEPITYSEIRYLDKKSNIFNDSMARMILTQDQDKIAFSLGLKNQWGIYQQQEFKIQPKNKFNS
ncbi:hypothetical protein, partial [Providencia heimbachae]|uniref:hypothetical protein n=5 Tax=Morganellaceae TaxID=1903414 RepID=UPI00224007E6